MSATATAFDVIEGRARWSDEAGDCLPWLRTLPDSSVDLVMCSPPYELARLYLEGGRNLGVARDTEAWVTWMVDVVTTCVRVCKGLCVFVVEGQTKDYRYSGGPVLLWAELIRRGICTRKAPIYRRVGIPGSGGPDWWRNDYEFCICATRGGRLTWSDNTSTGHPPKFGPGGEMSYRGQDGSRRNAHGVSDTTTRRRTGTGKVEQQNKPRLRVKGGSPKDPAQSQPAIANPGNVVQQLYTAAEVAELLGAQADVIDCAVGGGQMGSKLASENEAPYSEDLVAPFVRCFCPEGGIVLDPFSGSGTTLAVALKWGRRAIGMDLRPSQVELAARRIKEEATTLFDEVQG